MAALTWCRLFAPYCFPSFSHPTHWIVSSGELIVSPNICSIGTTLPGLYIESLVLEENASEYSGINSCKICMNSLFVPNVNLFPCNDFFIWTILSIVLKNSCSVFPSTNVLNALTKGLSLDLLFNFSIASNTLSLYPEDFKVFNCSNLSMSSILSELSPSPSNISEYWEAIFLRDSLLESLSISFNLSVGISFNNSLVVPDNLIALSTNSISSNWE